MRTPTICHICSFAPEYGGAFIESIIFLSRHCHSKLQINTFCIFPERAKNRSWLSKLDEAGIGYGFIPHKKNVTKEIRSLLSEREPVILHSHFFFFDLTVILLKCTVFRQASVVWHYHSQPPLTRLQKVKDLFKLGIIFRFWGGQCIAVGDGVFRSLRHAGLSADKVALIHNGIDTTRFTTDSESRANVRQSLKAASNSTVFLLLGYAPQIKGVDVFINAAAEVTSNSSLTNLFVIVGRRETREFVSQMPCASKLGEALLVIDPVEDFSNLLNGVDVLVSASRTEGFGYAVIEAMAAEKQILCSDIDPVRQSYGRSAGVRLFPSEDWKMLAQLMEKSSRLSLDDRQAVGLANRHYVNENYSIERWCEKVGYVYLRQIAGQAKVSEHDAQGK